MSNQQLQRFNNVKQVVLNEKKSFESISKINGSVNFEKEAAFALQALESNSYLQGAAMNNLDSLKKAFINVAAIGLSLNPMHKLAYLVPRKKEVCLDLSYLGLIKLATDCGVVKFVVANLVYEKDTFILKGIGQEPQHEYSPFNSRGDIVGVYCVAKLNSGEFITNTMSVKEVDAIRDRSESYKSGSNSPWKSDYGEMAKKTVIRRASKMWPKSDKSERFDKAIDLSNEYDKEDVINVSSVNVSDLSPKIEEIRKFLVTLERTEEVYIAHLKNVLTREIKSMSDLTEIELNSQIVALSQMVENRKKKVVKPIAPPQNEKPQQQNEQQEKIEEKES